MNLVINYLGEKIKVKKSEQVPKFLRIFPTIPKLEAKIMLDGSLEGSSRSVPTGRDVARKCRWNTRLCFLGPPQQCRCERQSKLSLCQWGGTASVLSSDSFLLLHCSSSCAFLWCDIVSSTRRLLASGSLFRGRQKITLDRNSIVNLEKSFLTAV